MKLKRLWERLIAMERIISILFLSLLAGIAIVRGLIVAPRETVVWVLLIGVFAGISGFLTALLFWIQNYMTEDTDN